MKKILLLLMLASAPAFADSLGSVTGGTAGTQSNMAGCVQQSLTLTAGQQAAVSCDTGGNIKTNSSPGQRTIVTLDVKTVTTGGTAVTALTAGHRLAGGFLQNPVGATVPLCINEIGTASGTTSSGDTTCIAPGQSYILAPASTAVSVITSDSSHPFSGYGLN